LVLRDSSGWQITPAGKSLLDWLKSGAASTNVTVTLPNALFSEAANDNGMVCHLSRFPTVGTPPAERS
jgi:hypothetical protein